MDRSRPEVGVQFMGVRGGRTDADRAALLDKLAALGVSWLRVGVPWEMLQPRPPSSPNGGWDVDGALARTDAVMRMAAERGLEVSVTFGRPPGWANRGRGSDHLPDRTRDFTRALTFLAERYRGEVQSWEIWNEPDHPNYLVDATAAQYVQLLCKSYEALKRTVPADTVVSGGTAGNDWEWVTQMYDAGAKGCFDVLATHPYNGGRGPTVLPENDSPWWFHNIKLVRDVMIENGDAATPVWFTEIGWSTAFDPNRPGSSGGGVSLEEQATYLVQMLSLTHNLYPYVQRVSWFNSQDEDTGKIHNDNFGLYTVSMQPKPAAAALRDYLAGGSG